MYGAPSSMVANETDFYSLYIGCACSELNRAQRHFMGTWSICEKSAALRILPERVYCVVLSPRSGPSSITVLLVSQFVVRQFLLPLLVNVDRCGIYLTIEKHLLNEGKVVTEQTCDRCETYFYVTSAGVTTFSIGDLHL
jgi:hypothetical protein